MKQKTNLSCKIGFPDHTSDQVAPIVAAAMGAEIIEKQGF